MMNKELLEKVNQQSKKDLEELKNLINNLALETLSDSEVASISEILHIIEYGRLRSVNSGQ